MCQPNSGGKCLPIFTFIKFFCDQECIWDWWVRNIYWSRVSMHHFKSTLCKAPLNPKAGKDAIWMNYLSCWSFLWKSFYWGEGCGRQQLLLMTTTSSYPQMSKYFIVVLIWSTYRFYQPKLALDWILIAVYICFKAIVVSLAEK